MTTEKSEPYFDATLRHSHVPLTPDLEAAVGGEQSLRLPVLAFGARIAQGAVATRG